MEGPPRVTLLLREAVRGSEDARAELLLILHAELVRIARAHMRRQRAGHTLQPTALVNEAYLRLFHGGAGAGFRDRSHFLAAASCVMRSVLVDMARARVARKRSAGGARVTLSDATPDPEARDGHDVLEVHEALGRLERIDPAWARVVELRFFGGLSTEEAAAAMGLSDQQVRRLWNRARAWLLRELSP